MIYLNSILATSQVVEALDNMHAHIWKPFSNICHNILVLKQEW